jgi:hypothetical protein
LHMWNLFLKNEWQECKIGTLGRWGPEGGERVKGQSEGGGWRWWRYFIYMYENRIMKPIKIIFLKGGWERRVEGVNLIKVHCLYVWKYHSETPLYNEYMLAIMLKRKRSHSSHFISGNKIWAGPLINLSILNPSIHLPIQFSFTKQRESSLWFGEMETGSLHGVVTECWPPQGSSGTCFCWGFWLKSYIANGSSCLWSSPKPFFTKKIIFFRQYWGLNSGLCIC